jgi:hypothetical protein
MPGLDDPGTLPPSQLKACMHGRVAGTNFSRCCIGPMHGLDDPGTPADQRHACMAGRAAGTSFSRCCIGGMPVVDDHIRGTFMQLLEPCYWQMAGSLKPGSGVGRCSFMVPMCILMAERPCTPGGVGDGPPALCKKGQCSERCGRR